MKKVLVDSSVWIEYFRGSNQSLLINQLIDQNIICTNDLILSELIPSLIHRDENHLVDLLKNIENIKIVIDWKDIINIQVINLKNGANKVGIADIIIFQNVIQNDLILWSFDKHFSLMGEYTNIHLFQGINSNQ